VQAPVVQAPAAQTPVVQAPVVQTPVVQAPVEPVAPVETTPRVATPAAQAPAEPSAPAVRVEAPAVVAAAVETPRRDEQAVREEVRVAPEPRAEQRPEPRAEQRPEPRGEQRPDQRGEQRGEQRPEGRGPNRPTGEVGPIQRRPDDRGGDQRGNDPRGGGDRDPRGAEPARRPTRPEEQVVQARVLSRPEAPIARPAPRGPDTRPVQKNPTPGRPNDDRPQAPQRPAAGPVRREEGDAPRSDAPPRPNVDGGMVRGPSDDEGPTRRPGVVRGPAPASQVRQPQPRAATPGNPPGGQPEAPAAVAKVLGRIPLDQLRSRTARPQQRRPGGPGGDMRGPGGPPGQRPMGPGGPGPSRPGMGPGGPGGPRGPARPGMGGPGGPRGPGGPPQPNMAVPVPPPDRGGERRRRPAKGTERARPGTPGAAAPTEGGSGRTQRGKRQVFSREDIYSTAGGATARAGKARKRKISSRKGSKTQLTTPAAHKRVVRINDTISVGELGKALGVKLNEIIRKLMQLGVMATANQQLDLDTATLVAQEYDYEVRNVAFQEESLLSTPAEQEKGKSTVDPKAVPRAPVVTIMGHVDHGKTTLLDRIRKANVAAGEAGGITQHVGAYRVEVGDRAVVFLDTPGHAAFTAMRARGASVTDVVVLVVASDDGIMPQTVESISHAKAAGVPIVVAITKVDKPGGDPSRIKQELTKYGLVPDEWGGDTFFVLVSAMTGVGIPELLETLALQSDVLELRANPDKPAYGRVVESRVEKGKGPVITVLVQEGTLKRGDFMVAGQNFGRVRAMQDARGRDLKVAGPSTPVEVLGLDGVAGAGDGFYVVANEKDAKKVIAARSDKARADREAVGPRLATAADLLKNMGKPEKEVQNIVLKTDVSGSLEAIRASMEKIGNEEVEVRIIHSGVGAISESDVTLAHASNAVLIGFNVGPDAIAKRAADQHGVEIKQYSIIYDVLDAVKEMLSGLLTPETVEQVLGHAEVRMVFHIQKVGQVAGCYVTDGKVLRNAQGRVMRVGKKVFEGKITTLKRFKDDAREVASGFECGLSIDGYKEVQPGDIIEVFELKEIRRQIA